MDFESETFVAHALRADGFDASEDGTGRGTPLVPCAIPIQEVGKRTGASTDDPRAGIGIGSEGDPMYTLQAGAQHGVYGFYGNDSGNDTAKELCPTLRAMPGGGGNHPAIAFQSSQSGVREVEAHATLDGNNGSRRHNGVFSYAGVRRLLPSECEALQGFPRGYTAIPGYNSRRTGEFGGNRGVADGPRYKALGNSMAVPVMAWIGRRIVEAEETGRERDVAGSMEPAGMEVKLGV